MLTVRVKINIASQTTPQIIPVVQGDTGRSVLFEIADFVIPASATATYYIKKPSGQAVYNAATIDGNTVLADLTAQSIAEVGENPGQVRILKNDEVVTSFDFILDVEPFRGIDAIESTTEMNVFDQAVQQALEEIDGSLESIVADEFSTSDSYLEGEYVLKDGALYRFTSNHAAGAWSTSDTEAVTIGEALTELDEGGGGGGAVNSVNGKTGTVVLDAGDLEYDDEETYSSGTVGKALTDLNGDLSDIDERVTALEEGGSGSGLTNDIKQALLQLAAKVAYVDDDGQDYYDDLHDALYTLVSISAVYTQSGTVYTSDSLDSLKSDLVVTALYDDQSTETVTNYTLSGTLTAGTSTITVSYGGKTTTFTVTVTAAKTLSSISAVYTQSGTVYETDSLDSLKTDLVVTAHWSDSTTSTVASADYTLSGTLTVGTSTVTVSYGGKTTTFDVIVSQGALYPIPSGKAEFTASSYSGKSIETSNGNHAKFVASSVSSNYGVYAIIDDIENNSTAADTANINAPTTPIFTLPAGASVVFEITNIQYQNSGGDASAKKFAIALRSGSTSKVTTGDLNESTTSKTVTATIASDTNITCLFVFVGTRITNLEFDIALTVNGVRWI